MIEINVVLNVRLHQKYLKMYKCIHIRGKVYIFNFGEKSTLGPAYNVFSNNGHSAITSKLFSYQETHVMDIKVKKGLV